MQTSKRTAICFSGELRTLDKTFHLLKNDIFDPFGYYDVFYYGWTDDPQIKNIKYLTKFENLKDLELEDRKFFQEGEIFVKRPKELDDVWQFIPRQLYLLKKVNELKQKHETENGFVYDCVVRVRPDLFIREGTLFDVESYDMKNLFMLDHDEWHGLCDRFYFSSSKNMDIVMNMFDRIPFYSSIGGKNYGEGFLKFVVDYHDIPVKKLNLKTSLLRVNGEQEGELVHIETGTIEKHSDGRIFHIPSGNYI